MNISVSLIVKIVVALIGAIATVIAAIIARKSKKHDEEHSRRLPAEIFAIPLDQGLTKQQQSLVILKARMEYIAHPETIVEYLGPGEE
jgi:hypothetical protein